MTTKLAFSINNMYLGIFNLERVFKKINMLKFKLFEIKEIRVCVTIMGAVKWGKLCIKRVKIAV